MKVRMLKGCAGLNFSYKKGGTYEVADEAVARDLLQAGFAEMVGNPRTAKKETPEKKTRAAKRETRKR